MGFIVLLWVIAGLNIAVAAAGPKRLREMFGADPAGDPSEQVARTRRVMCGVIGAATVVFSVGLGNYLGLWESTDSQVRAAAQEAADDLDGETVMPEDLGEEADGLYTGHVSSAVGLAASPDLDLATDHVRTTRAGEEHYVVTTSDGDSPHCITVTAEERTLLVPTPGEATAAPYYSLSAALEAGDCG